MRHFIALLLEAFVSCFNMYSQKLAKNATQKEVEKQQSGEDYPDFDAILTRRCAKAMISGSPDVALRGSSSITNQEVSSDSDMN